MAPQKYDLYQTLGLERSASAEEGGLHRAKAIGNWLTRSKVRKAYRRKALQTHPDRLPKDATDQDIKNAAEDFRIVCIPQSISNMSLTSPIGE
jgi:DnaJ family protein B protein 6